MVSDILTKVFSLTFLAFLVALFATPLLTNFLYKYKLGKQIRSGEDVPIFNSLHEKKKGTPTMGGILVWGVTGVLAFVFWFLDRVTNIEFFHTYNFLTRKETLLPLGAFVGASLVGLADDFLDIKKLGHNGRGFRFRFKVLLYMVVAIIGAWWFYVKLDFSTIFVPFYGPLELSWLFVPFFILVVVGTSFAVNQTDGLDGLAGGTLLISFFAFGLIAFLQGRDNLASLIGVVSGGLLAFLWFNVYPARFFMGDTGSMGLGVLLAMLAFLTNSILLLPIIGFVFVLEAGTTIIQITSKRLLGKKVFKSAPIHHHFEAIGWPETKVTMRFWIISSVASIIGVVVYFIGK
jgi:phospho-N-acetylmuramoyl-pentapeptide-transferase